MRTAVAAFALALLTTACVPSCGTDSLPLPPQAGTDGTPDAGTPGTPDAGTPAPDGGTDGGTTPDAGTPDAGTDGGTAACLPSGDACGADGACCSNRCPSGACGPMCFADGQACARATDCCSLACNGGTCGGALCLQDGKDCTSSAACCSNACVGSKCVAVRTGCRPAGERCSGGGFALNVCCGAPPATCIAPGTATQHCDLPSDVCRGAGVACSLASDCCSNICSAGFCG
jgi:hypothetical protein